MVLVIIGHGWNEQEKGIQITREKCDFFLQRQLTAPQKGTTSKVLSFDSGILEYFKPIL